METSNSTSSLKERLKKWRAEISGAGLTKDDIDELQSHIEDVLNDLLGNGLNEDEAWIIAMHRLGDSKIIKTEFKKIQDDRIPLVNHILYWLMLGFAGITILIIGREIILYTARLDRVPGVILTCFIILIGILWSVYKRNIRHRSRSDAALTAVPIILISMVFIFFTDLEGPKCQNSNAIFNNNSPQTDIYVKELARHFTQAGTDNVYYRFNYYFSRNGKDYAAMNAIGKDFCAVMNMDITGSERLKNLIRVKGMSYRNSVWKGLKFDMVSNKSGSEFIFRDVKGIMD